MKNKPVSQSKTIKAMLVLPPDSNSLGTMFGGRVMHYIDDIAAIAAARHARMTVVTASTDSVDFLQPIKVGEMICMEAIVTWTHRTSMEIFVKVTGENLKTGRRKVCATSFLTFVGLDKHGRPQPVPGVIPESEYEKELNRTALDRVRRRKERITQARELAEKFGIGN